MGDCWEYLCCIIRFVHWLFDEKRPSWLENDGMSTSSASTLGLHEQGCVIDWSIKIFWLFRNPAFLHLISLQINPWSWFGLYLMTLTFCWVNDKVKYTDRNNENSWNGILFLWWLLLLLADQYGYCSLNKDILIFYLHFKDLFSVIVDVIFVLWLLLFLPWPHLQMPSFVSRPEHWL